MWRRFVEQTTDNNEVTQLAKGLTMNLVDFVQQMDMWLTSLTRRLHRATLEMWHGACWQRFWSSHIMQPGRPGSKE